MHKCVRCGRAATSLMEINSGCPCGSKVFVFNREAMSASIAGEEVGPKGSGAQPPAQDGIPFNAKEAPGAKGDGAAESDGAKNGDGKAPESYFARMAFTDEDVENIKVVTEGVFSIDLNALSKNPVVLKDEEGVYYVRIPFEQSEGNGKDGRKRK